MVLLLSESREISLNTQKMLMIEERWSGNIGIILWKPKYAKILAK
jgi:hypothetical protein